MSLFLETIKINNGRRINLDGHNRRMNFTRNRHFHEIRDIDLRDEIEVPTEYEIGIVKCRVSYGRKVEKVEFEPYIFRNPQSFKLVNADHIDYKYKSADREALQELFAMKGEADDIIMVKDGLITDSYYANLVLLKDQVWYTPAKPLLQGTFRSKMLENEKLVEIDINEEELPYYEEIKIVNALTEWEMHKGVQVLIGKTVYGNLSSL